MLLEFQENDNCKRVVEFCAERGLCVGNALFKPTSLNKYKRVARGQDGVELKSMIDLVLVKRDMLRYVQDVRAVREWNEAYQTTMLYCVKSGC